MIGGCFTSVTTRSTTYPITISGSAATHSQNPVSTSTGLPGSVVGSFSATYPNQPPTSAAQYVSTMSAPARRMLVNVSSATVCRSIHPLAPAASRPSRTAATWPSIIPLGPTTPAPDLACATANSTYRALVASLSTLPAESRTPQWP